MEHSAVLGSDDFNNGPERDERRLVEMRGYLIVRETEIIDVRVVNLSYDGCGIETTVPLEVGERLKLSILARGTIRATVRWCRDREAGLRFEMAPALQRHWPRRQQRSPMNAEVLLRRSGKLGYRVRVFDASSEGCRCEFVERPRIGERVWLKFDGLEGMESAVCWIEGSHVGLKYVNAIHPAVFSMLLDRLGAG